MVKLEELEDEHFINKPDTTKDGALLVDDDEDYTDTDSEISEDDAIEAPLDETLLDRLAALRDIVPPKTRARLASATQSVYSAANASITYGGKSLWVIATSILLLGIPYALALGEEQQYMEEERQRTMMEQGQQGIIQQGQPGGQGDAKPAL
ncbi:uncharacterized protein Z520_00876 [Fonsecaea multimorphosa CBS 102226]|uniref:Mitochondrial import receptor subunit tom22 n=1 Tax=Fonsecaea multimorphosa CBS 102226 TaxID=1442371 RepID=A0A0D2L524_9EURO|nr:uncharacterized protein Z520_00876 [Fonsecaea multimorphosa CBS 102226]KIY04184.1 hypothetical protein Z520_00876 [Fonsecaea multimorphosa CBS 102226]OAL32013.1 hypothetical protein AYO22_00883 [Fonsecaea multimorphosa]